MTTAAVRQGQRAEIACEGWISQALDDDVFQHIRRAKASRRPARTGPTPKRPTAL